VAIHRSKLGYKDKSEALKNLSVISEEMEEAYTPNDYFDGLIRHERHVSHKYGGKTVMGDAKKPEDIQLRLF
jgi:hypothetical protein